MTLVDPYHDRVFRNGRVYGVNYDEQTMKPTYSDISPFGGGRMAGDGLGLDSDVVLYMGRAAQGMPQDQGMDVRIAEGMLKAMGRAIEPVLYRPDQDRAELRTLEYVPGRDGPATPEILGPYNPDTDDSGVETLLAGNPSFDITGRSGDARRKRRDLTPGDVNRLMNAYPDDAEKIRKMYLPGAALPRV